MNIHRAIICWIAAILILVSPSAFAEEPAVTNREILQELRELRAMMKEIREELAKLKEDKEKEAEESEDDDDWPTVVGSFRRRQADTTELKKIKLPENATEEQVKEYIQKIVDASRKQNSFSSEDPQVRMLHRIGPKHFHLLLESMESTGHPYAFGGNYHVRQAVLKLAREEHKMLILAALARLPFLVQIISDRGWEKDARIILLAELRSGDQRLPTEWITAVADLRDPKTYNDLKRYLVDQDNRHSTYEAIRDLPGIDLTDAVAKAWTERGHHDWEKTGIAKVAVQYGHLDALEYLIDLLQDEQRNRWQTSSIRALLRRHMDFYGSTKEMAEWLKKNKGGIVFDNDTKKFKVGGVPLKGE
jgi:hypothetical protein